jgi:chromosome segregation ATPase
MTGEQYGNAKEHLDRMKNEMK